MSKHTSATRESATPERIIHHLQRNQWRIEDSTPEQGAELKRMLDTATFVTADDIGQWFRADKRDDYDLGVNTGPARLPFPRMWVETYWPGGQIWGASGWMDCPRMSSAYLLTEGTPAEDGSFMMTALQFVMIGGRVYDLGFIEMQKMNADGTKHQKTMSYSFTPYTDRGARLLAVIQERGTLGNLECLEALVIIGFMNCRNVTVFPAPAEERPGKKGDRDKRLGLKRMNTIVVPGFTVKSTDAGARQALGAPVAPHMVRGHFKRYTEEKPLLGKITGTYWWGHHVRAGEQATPKPYDVRKPKDAA